MTMVRSMTILEVSDIRQSAAFYRDALGFTPGRFWGDPPAFCIVGRDTVTIALDQSRDAGRTPQNQYWAVYVYVDDIAAVIADFKDRGTTIARGPADTVYDCREIDVVDPDGHIICFAQDLDLQPAGPGL